MTRTRKEKVGPKSAYILIFIGLCSKALNCPRNMAESQLFYCFLQIFRLGSVFRMKLHNHRYLEVVDIGFCWILMCWIMFYPESCLPTNIGRKLDPKRYFFLDFDSLRKVVRTFNRIHGYPNTHVYREGNIV